MAIGRRSAQDPPSISKDPSVYKRLCKSSAAQEMISSSEDCRKLVAGNFDVIVDEPPAQLKTILTNFLNRFQQYESELQQTLVNPSFQAATNTTTQFDDKQAKNNNNIGDANNRDTANGAQSIIKCNYANEFRLLKEFSKGLKADKSKFEAGERDYNSSKNRYKDIIPFTHTRVTLSSQDTGGESTGDDYINANYICGSSGLPRAYIAAQGPLANTLNEFWRMVWECQVSVIVMACNEHESGETKCEVYWPRELGRSQRYGLLEVTFLNVRHICPDFLVRKFSLKLLSPEPSIESNAEQQQIGETIAQARDQTYNIQQHEHEFMKRAQLVGQHQLGGSSSSVGHNRVIKERTICQFHYTTWPDHGVPVSVDPILEMVKLMRDVQPDDHRPILVHCSAGCGRTGTICCIDYVWNMLKRGTLDEDFNLCRIVSDMRQQRMSMVQTLEQYILCHKAVATLFTRQLSLMETCNSMDGNWSSNNRNADAFKINGFSQQTIENKLDAIVKDDELNKDRDLDETDYQIDEDEEDLGPVFI